MKIPANKVKEKRKKKKKEKKEEIVREWKIRRDDWIWFFGEWHEFSGPITEYSEAKPT